MAYCGKILNIDPSEFLGNSLRKINTNWSNLDTNICLLSSDVQKLRTYINSLSVSNLGSINLWFDPVNYSLSADIKDSFIGTNKLGQDIPQTTRLFLTAAKVSSLADVTVNNIQNDNTLRWTGTGWVNTPLTDEIGARALGELKDVRLANVLNNNILKYNSTLSAWQNIPDDGLGKVDDGNYEDILVSSVVGGTGQTFKINPSKVGSLELANSAVTTAKISSLQVTNDKIANATITLTKFSDNLGEINTGTNTGTGQGKICLTTNQGTQIPIKRIQGQLGCTVTSDNNHIIISAQIPPPPQPPTGGNLGNGIKVFRDPVQVSTTTALYNFKTLKASTGISITETETDITINQTPTIGTSVLGVGAGGEVLTDAQIKDRVAQIFPPDRFSSGTVCNVLVENPGVAGSTTISISVPFSLSYRYENKTYTVPGKCISGCSPSVTYVRMLFEVTDPQATENTVLKRVKRNGKWREIEVGTNIFSGEKDITSTNTVPAGSQPKMISATRTITFTKSGNSWV